MYMVQVHDPASFRVESRGSMLEYSGNAPPPPESFSPKSSLVAKRSEASEPAPSETSTLEVARGPANLSAICQRL